MTREEAFKLLQKYNKDEGHLRHSLQVEAVMRYFARRAGEDEEEWGIVGLLHDLDYEMWPDQHCLKSGEILREKGIDEVTIRAIMSHGWGICTDVKPENEMEKTLYAIDELTGLIWAASLMRPSKRVDDMELKSVKKKFKDKAFASGVDREIIRKGAEMLEMELDELLNETLQAMKEYEASQN